MNTDTVIKIVNLILNVFGLPTGLFSKVKDAISIGKDIAAQNKLSKKEKYIIELKNMLENITWDENAFEDVQEKILITLADGERFSAKRILHYYNQAGAYSKELTESWYGDPARQDPSAESYQSTMEQILQSVYKHLPVLEVASDAEEAVLKKLYSYDALFAENNAILEKLQYRGTFAEWVDHAELPAPISGNIFSFCNRQIKLRGRESELEQLKSFVKQPGISVWGIVGVGGSGKSKLAREFALMERPDRTVVWLNQIELNKIPDFADYSYSRPILFICDYAAQFEDRLKTLIERLSTKPLDAKFLLLERQQTWYADYLSKEDRVNDLAFKEQSNPKMPLNLTEAVLDEAVCRQIMTDLNFSKDGNSRRYPDKTLIESDYQKIYQRALALSENKKSVRCLFLLLLTDAFLRDENIQEMDAGALLKNYINHSAQIMRDQHGKIIADTGFLILAYATAFDGLTWHELTESNNHACMKKHWDDIKSAFSSGKERRSFLRQLSEAECEQDIVPPLKPDLIGEYLFLNKWNDCADEQDTWFAELLTNEYALHFLSLCLIDWPVESENLCDILSDQSADVEQRVHCAEVFKQAVRKAFAEETQKHYIDKIEKLGVNSSSFILLKYTEALLCLFRNGNFQTKEECLSKIRLLKYDQIYCETEQELEALYHAWSGNAIMHLEFGNYRVALHAFTEGSKICEELYGLDHLDTATFYNNIGLAYYHLEEYDNSLMYYERAIEIRKTKLSPFHPFFAMTYCNIALMYYEKKEFNLALQFFCQAQAIVRETPELDPSFIVKLYNGHGVAYFATGKIIEAQKMFADALAIVESDLANNMLAALTYNNLAMICQEKEEWDLALKYYEKSLEIGISNYGPYHPDCANTYNNIGMIYLAKGDYKTAVEYFQKDEKITEKVFGPSHIKTQKIYRQLFFLFLQMHDHLSALKYHAKMIFPSLDSHDK